MPPPITPTLPAYQGQLVNGQAPVAGYSNSAPNAQGAPTFGVDPSTVPSTNPNNPVGSSTGTRAGISSLQDEINSLTQNGQANSDLLSNYRSTLATDRANVIASIDADYTNQEKTQSGNQATQYAGRSTGLVTSGGGFLGTTQSQSGVLQSLQDSFVQQNQALQAKHQAAVQAAQSAYDEKDFTAAKAMIDQANQTQQDIYKAQTDYANQQLQITQENQAQLQYQTGQTEKQATAYAALTPTQYAQIPQAEKDAIDKVYYPGYLDALNKTTQQAKDVQNAKDQESLDASIMDIRLKVPAGQTFKLNGTTYTGLQTKDATQSQINQSIISQVGTLFSGAKDPKGQNVYTIPGSGGIPFVYQQGTSTYATPEGWKAAISESGMDRAAFIKQFGYMIPQGTDITDTTWQKYGLTPGEAKIITGQLPVPTDSSSTGQ